MDESSDAVSRPKVEISDLPDEVFVLILMLLPFPDQVRVRRVSTYWRTAVHFVFGKQETIRISLQEKEYESEVRSWELESLGFNFDSGINIFITYPPKTNQPDALWVPRSRIVPNPECPVKRQAVTRFCSAVDFAIHHFNGTRIAEISWGFPDYMRDYSPKYWRFYVERAFKEEDRDRMQDVSNRFAFRFQNQLLCFVNPLFHLTPQHEFPVVKHLTLMGVSHEI